MKEFKTSDLYFSAFLIASGCSLKKPEKQGHRVFFIFDHIPFIDELKLEFFNGSADTKALNYANQIKNLKSLVHSVMNS